MTAVTSCISRQVIIVPFSCKSVRQRKAVASFAKSFGDCNRVRLGNQMSRLQQQKEGCLTDFRASLRSKGSSNVINETVSQLGRRLMEISSPRTSMLHYCKIRLNMDLHCSLGHVLRITPGGSHLATFSLSRLTSDNRCKLESFPRILSKRTASTSMAP
jgi:hypothetical protein